MSDTPVKVPAHLRRFVVEQDYQQYNAIDQAVWRFVLLQTSSRLAETAHPAYRDGLAATGISLERIPSIAEMNQRLSRFGWGAVCVDGFIPPRAFQEFQASSILPIAADIRTREHLVYTPAPDIIHEAAGHAPIMIDPVFSGYLRRIGDLGRKAFTLPEEDAVYQAIYRLSQMKEDPSNSEGEVARAEADVRAALAGASIPSEATRLSRLYWWTAEYGLVGRLGDYKIYGAGLLSSLWEGHSCHAPAVDKAPLDESCTEVTYDITRSQPRLFVVSSFEALHDVLDGVARTLAVEIGGEVALARALRSHEVATVHFSSGAQVLGVLAEVGPSSKDPAWLAFDGPAAFARDGVIGPDVNDAWRPSGCVVLTGGLANGERLETATEGMVDQLRCATTGRHQFVFASGASVEGRLEVTVRSSDGRLCHLRLAGAHVSLPGQPPRELAHFVLLAAGDPLTAQAGAVDPTYHRETQPVPAWCLRAPRRRPLPPCEQRLLALYEQAKRAHTMGQRAMRTDFPRVWSALMRDHPPEWLLRWNLLESLLKAGEEGELALGLRAELERLEVEFEHRQPIASGLRYLSEQSLAT
jgi:phenylalanine-4-hydroxylase